jgi:transcriptional regulator with XRE-family HTH domain
MQELATQLGQSSHGFISELEAGKKLPAVENVLSIARLFCVTTDELLKDELELGETDAGRSLEPGERGRNTNE